MAHELTIRKNGMAEMAYTGDTPWHGLGQELPEGATVAEFTTAAGMDWKINRSKIRFATTKDAAAQTIMEGKHVLWRSDTKAPLSIVSSSYHIVQPRQVMEYFELLADKAGFKLSTAGTLFGGKRFWAMADAGEGVVLDPTDKMRSRLLMATSCDGTMATILKFIRERVVCHNTFSRGLAEKGKEVRVIHSSQFDEKKVNAELGIQMREEFEQTLAVLRQLAETPMSDEDMALATVQLIAGEAVKSMSLEELIDAANAKLVKRVGGLAITGDGLIGADLDGGKGTAWGWLNAVTQVVDHEGSSTIADNRLNSAWFGAGDRLKSRAEVIANTFLPGGEAYRDGMKGACVMDKILA